MWCSQNANGQGSLNPDIYEEKELYKEESKEFGDEFYIEWLDDNEELSELTSIFNLVDFKYTNGIAIGKEYTPMKDLLEMYGYNLKTSLPVLINMSKTWCNHIQYNQSKG